MSRKCLAQCAGTRFFSSPFLCILLCCFVNPFVGASELYFTLLHTNDEHSAVLPYPFVNYHPEKEDPTVGGFARLGGLVKTIREDKEGRQEPVVLVSAGDFLGGYPHFWLIPYGESPEISLMQQIGYDVVTIGNHEFDFGSDALGRYFLGAGYPDAHETTALVSSNLVIPNGHSLAACGIRETHILELDNGLRLGFFGLLGNNAAQLASKKTPVKTKNPLASARTALQRLRQEDVDIVIAVTHAGRDEDEALIKAVPGIDILVAGHYHLMALDPPLRVDNTIMAQSSAYLRHLGLLELAFNPETGTLRIRNEESGQPFLVPLDDSVAMDPEVASSITAYTEKLDDLIHRLTDGAVVGADAPIMQSDFVLQSGPDGRESMLGNFVTDAMRFMVEQKTGRPVDFAIQANGVIRQSLHPGTMPHNQNQILFYDLAAAIGLGTGYDETPGYPLASIYLTGREIYRMLELTLYLSRFSDVFFLQLSGGRFSYDPSQIALFNLPVKHWPIPSFRAVQAVEKFTGDGIQQTHSDAYVPLFRKDNTLYHVVCDYYILSFFPRIAKLLPFYKVVPKNQDGQPIDPQDAIIHTGEQELKFWQAVVKYALAQPVEESGIPKVPALYGHTDTRILHSDGSHVFLRRPGTIAILFACLLLFAMMKRLRRMRIRPAHPK